MCSPYRVWILQSHGKALSPPGATQGGFPSWTCSAFGHFYLHPNIWWKFFCTAFWLLNHASFPEHVKGSCAVLWKPFPSGRKSPVAESCTRLAQLRSPKAATPAPLAAPVQLKLQVPPGAGGLPRHRLCCLLLPAAARALGKRQCHIPRKGFLQPHSGANSRDCPHSSGILGLPFGIPARGKPQKWRHFLVHSAVLQLEGRAMASAQTWRCHREKPTQDLAVCSFSSHTAMKNVLKTCTETLQHHWHWATLPKNP